MGRKGDRLMSVARIPNVPRPEMNYLNEMESVYTGSATRLDLNDIEYARDVYS